MAWFCVITACSYAATTCSLAKHGSLAKTTKRRQIFSTVWFFFAMACSYAATVCSLATLSTLATPT
jgi:hypothetical protein